MLRVYHSNRLDVLEALMEFIVERQRLDDPFQAEMVLVQSTGMAQWLQMTLAARFGIAANIEFPLPASFIWDMFVRVLKDIPGDRPDTGHRGPLPGRPAETACVCRRHRSDTGAAG